MTPETDDDLARTVPMVPLSELAALARLGLAMRKAQRAYFDARKRYPGLQPDGLWRQARDAEKRFDAAVADAFAREKPQLPGMEGGAS